MLKIHHGHEIADGRGLINENNKYNMNEKKYLTYVHSAD